MNARSRSATDPEQGGVLYVAYGSGHFIDLASVSASSLREHTTDLPCWLATDADPTRGDFDGLIRFPREPTSIGRKRRRIEAMAASPFERTLYLDCDTFILADVRPILDVLERFDIAAVHAPVGIGHPHADVPSSFPEHNTGVLAWRRSVESDGFFRDWLHAFDGSALVWDQPSLRQALYFSDLRIGTLPPEWNVRFNLLGAMGGPPKILHGHPPVARGEGDPATRAALDAAYRRVARDLAHPSRGGEPAGFVGGRVFVPPYGRQVADYGARRRRSLRKKSMKQRLESLLRKRADRSR